MQPSQATETRLEVTASAPGQETILTTDAKRFVASLASRFGSGRDKLLQQRIERQNQLDGTGRLDFLPETEAVRAGDWTVAPIPGEASDRRTEITGPVNRKMVINALNSGAQVYMADFEDSTAPTWANVIDGQVNLRDAVNGTISFDGGLDRDGRPKHYRLNEKTALLMVRPRGWHLPESHVLLDGRPISGSLLDFGLFLFHNHAALADKGSRPYFYLPKLEHYREARLWNDVISHAEELLGLAPGTVKVTVLIETLPAAFQMDEILYELRSRIQGLNCGRWDYIFSYIKSFRNHSDHVLPDRSQVTMDKGFLSAYSLLLIKTCHRRGAMAMGGMAAQIPVKGDERANAAALEKVRADKRREATAGHDGTWVAHPALEPIARAEFDAAMPAPNQIHRQLDEVSISAEDLLRPVAGTISEDGLRNNIRVALLYLSAWLGGNGCVPIDHLMEDAATAEISRAQLWQWIRHPAGRLDSGEDISHDLYQRLAAEVVDSLGTDAGKHLADAARLLDEFTAAEDLAPFLTLKAYQMIS